MTEQTGGGPEDAVRKGMKGVIRPIEIMLRQSGTGI